MKAAGIGVILNVGWDQAEQGMAGDSGELFATSKGAVMAFTKSLARSLAPQVRVNCLAPGWIKTSWGENASQEWQDRAVREALLSPLGHARGRGPYRGVPCFAGGWVHYRTNRGDQRRPLIRATVVSRASHADVRAAQRPDRSMNREHVHFVTGRLAAESLHNVLADLAPRVDFDYSVSVLGITVAALMTPRWVAQRLALPAGTTRVVVPGYCQGDLEGLQAAAGVPVDRGPKDLRDLPEWFQRR